MNHFGSIHYQKNEQRRTSIFYRCSILVTFILQNLSLPVTYLVNRIKYTLRSKQILPVINTVWDCWALSQRKLWNTIKIALIWRVFTHTVLLCVIPVKSTCSHFAHSSCSCLCHEFFSSSVLFLYQYYHRHIITNRYKDTDTTHLSSRTSDQTSTRTGGRIIFFSSFFYLLILMASECIILLQLIHNLLLWYKPLPHY